MTQQEKNKEFKKITDKMLELYSSKNELYGDSFNQLMHELGLVAGLVPLDNKLRRIKSIIKGTEVKYESLEDSLFDLADYAIMMIIHLREKEKNKTTLDFTDLSTTGGIVTVPKIQVMPDIILKNPCETCPNNNREQVYQLGDSPCQWCKYGTQITCTTGDTHA